MAVGRIEWVPIAEMPEALKDGRPLLLWVIGFAWIADWRRGAWYSDAWERSGRHAYPIEPTHFAEINGPEGE